jgi:hypothetical protein
MLGAAIVTIGIMFLIITGLSYTGLVPMPPVSPGIAIVSLLVATNGYLILLYGIITTGQAKAPQAA